MYWWGSVFAKQTKTSLYSVVGVKCSIDLVYNATQHCIFQLLFANFEMAKTL